jgi:hypothetical protein
MIVSESAGARAWAKYRGGRFPARITARFRGVRICAVNQDLWALEITQSYNQ